MHLGLGPRKWLGSLVIVFHRPPADPQQMKHCYTAAAPSALRSDFSWCVVARVIVGPGVPGAHQSVATGRPGARFVDFSSLGPHAGGVLGASDASVISTLL